MMIQAVLGNPHHPEYGVATIPFPIPRDQYAHCIRTYLETHVIEGIVFWKDGHPRCKIKRKDFGFPWGR